MYECDGHSQFLAGTVLPGGHIFRSTFEDRERAPDRQTRTRPEACRTGHRRSLHVGTPAPVPSPQGRQHSRQLLSSSSTGAPRLAPGTGTHLKQGAGDEGDGGSRARRTALLGRDPDCDKCRRAAPDARHDRNFLFSGQTTSRTPTLGSGDGGCLESQRSGRWDR